MKIRSVLPIALLCIIMWAGPASAATINFDTIVITNEGGLIDNMIAAGHGPSTLYAVLQYLEPYSGGTISASFMTTLTTLATTDPGSEVFTVGLFNFAGPYNPVCANGDGIILSPVSFTTRMTGVN